MSDGALAKVVDIVLGRIIRPGERRATLRAEADALPYAELKRQEAKDIELAETLRRAELLNEGRNLRMASVDTSNPAIYRHRKTGHLGSAVETV